MIEAAAETGKAVFCEKPVALDLTRTRQALATVADKGVPFQIGFQRRFDLGYAEAKRRIEASVLGRLDNKDGYRLDHYHFFMDRFGPAFRAELEAFFQAVSNGQPPSPGPSDALESLRIALAATRSLKEGRSVKLTEIQNRLTSISVRSFLKDPTPK